jgi:hypothetical protein
VGRNVDEIIRLIKAFQFVEEHGEVCPANWQPGDITMSADPVLSKKYFSGSILDVYMQRPIIFSGTIYTYNKIIPVMLIFCMQR